MSTDKFCLWAQDQVKAALNEFLPELLELAPAGLEHLYTYQAFGAKDMFPDPKPFRVVSLTVSNGLFVDRTSVINAKLIVTMDSTQNDERSEAGDPVPDADVLGEAHRVCYGAMFEWLVTHDFEWLEDAEIVTADQEEANVSLVDSATIDIYFNTPTLP